MFLVIFFERFDGFEKLFLFSLINIKTQLLKRSKEVLVAKKKIRGPSHNYMVDSFVRILIHEFVKIKSLLIFGLQSGMSYLRQPITDLAN